MTIVFHQSKEPLSWMQKLHKMITRIYQTMRLDLNQGFITNVVCFLFFCFKSCSWHRLGSHVDCHNWYEHLWKYLLIFSPLIATGSQLLHGCTFDLSPTRDIRQTWPITGSIKILYFLRFEETTWPWFYRVPHLLINH